MRRRFAECKIKRGGAIEIAEHHEPLGNRLIRHFGIEVREIRAFGYFALLFFLLGAGLALGRGSSNSLFLKRFGVAHLPETYAIIGLTLFVASMGYAALADRLRPERLLWGVLLVLAALLGVNWTLIVYTDLMFAYPVYFIIFELVSELLALHATLYFSCNFDSLQVKRLLPLGLASLQAGGMCGGIGLAGIAAYSGSQHAAAAWAVLALLAAALVAKHHGKGKVSPFYRPQRRGGGELRRALDQVLQGIRFTGRSALLRFASIGIFFMVVALYCASYASKAVLVVAFPNEAELTIVFGVLAFVTGATALLIQAFFTGKLLLRFGVRTMNLVFPLTTIAVVCGMIFFPGVAAALVVMLNRHVVMPAIRNPVRSLLFEALPDWMQGRARALSLGLVLPLALFASGLLLHFSQSIKPGLAVLLPALLAAFLFFYLSIRMNAAYVHSMLMTLKEKLYLPEGQAGELGRGEDAQLLEELINGVKHGDDQVALAYARVLISGFPAQAADVILERMRTANVRTRDALLRLVGPCLPHQLVKRLEVEGGDAHETSTRLSLHLSIAGDHAAGLIEKCLAAKNPRLVGCGIVGAFQHEDEEWAHRGAHVLEVMLRSDQETTLLSALEALRTVRATAFSGRICSLLSHPSPRVQRGCLQALAAIGRAEIERIDPLVESIYASRDHQLRAACVRCYALLEPSRRDSLCLRALSDNHPLVAMTAMDTLHQCSENFGTLLLSWLCDQTIRPRAQEVVLDYLKLHGLLLHVLPTVAESKIATAEMMAHVLYLLDKSVLGMDSAEGANALFRIVLRERVGQAIRLALAALEPIVDRNRLRIVRASLHGRDRRQVARAIEALSHVDLPLVSGRLRNLLLSLNGSGMSQRMIFPDALTALNWARHSADEWLRECALADRSAGGVGA